MIVGNKAKYTNLIKEEAIRLGFMSCGISKAGFLEEEAPRLEEWLNKNRNGKMSYMENHFDKRLDPTKLVDGSKSVISLLLNYYPDKVQNPESYKISKYAYGKDYHFVIKDKLKSLLQFIQSEIGEVAGRAFVDSAPVLDKAWAAKSGLGWIGKNSNLLSKKAGSFFFIAELIVDLELEEDTPVTDHCGTCTACIDACPTNAIVEPYKVDGSKCISYFTIELKDELPNSFKNTFEDWMFGCDICQDVCPWNRFSKPHNEPLFDPHPDLLKFDKKDWQEITRETFNEIFRKSAVKRTKFEGLKRNIKFLDS
ncbi:MAG: tRNA epoxyqueuosine(34) reductase QueG [Zunongwangia sp.]|uniref:Epoxyqueuosine reductase n=1 Tax=Zunongwangia profunda TaxID=398743 RepID=A0A3D5IXA1_9FLAO|nr:tRNA epoxyqueuosine(34) reductase QueG [Zunongwangia profunda]MAC63630.1 tRNA epoxyqueuosine(34) reductase QueG [Flavobacteriaceae bacterium]MAO34390.1 tRNA epoxyqueuosine(34) reductase QueG [Zunongwangia sp.]MAG87763.1 tRNA epoxyqueuosine(34) reductase QueG [Flavobacteriaceae bacterium]MAS72504.1 tRNA epoxyqueuosine(34) reductase QueG [Zunongwangia sp.]MCC4227282.1 tRNA epoxyqueuosine(34) reductase QueG [Zunongwangia profunda]|tara:strand:+ start:1275 stop:2204 length:930 start_codon:yes stop_codon:yes gene_type:complete